MTSHSVAVKRIYEPASRSDGFRVLVDRVWPRGLSKSRANVDLWLREIAPSTELRTWFDHDPVKWKGFCARYRAELRLKRDLLAVLRKEAERGPVTLLYGARNERINQAVVLQELLNRPSKRPARRAPRPVQSSGASRARRS